MRTVPQNKIWVDPTLIEKIDAIREKIMKEKGLFLSRPRFTKMLADKIEPESFDLEFELIKKKKRPERVRGQFEFKI